MKNVEFAREFAKRCHEGQTYADKPYYDYHICGVVDILRYEVVGDKVLREDQVIAAILHDFFEDCKGGNYALLETLFSSRVATHVSILTNTFGKNDRNYDDYITSIECCNFTEVQEIKLADALFNYRNNLDNPRRKVKYLNVIHRMCDCLELDVNEFVYIT